jgi:uncharacterized membrane protein
MTDSLAHAPHLPHTLPTPAVQRSRWLSFCTCLLLALLGLVWELALARTGTGSLAVKVIPLLLALPGLWRMRLYTYRWLSLAVWLYAAEGAVRAYGPVRVELWLAGLEIVLAVLLFTACAWHVRARLAAGRQHAAAAATATATATA